MHSLFVRIFVLFWKSRWRSSSGGSIAIHSRWRPANSNLRHAAPSNVAIQARSLGRAEFPPEGLARENRSPLDDRDLFIIGPDGRDILGRNLSASAARRMEFLNHDIMQDPKAAALAAAAGKFRPAAFRPADRGPDGRLTPSCWCRRPSAFAR